MLRDFQVSPPSGDRGILVERKDRRMVKKFRFHRGQYVKKDRTRHEKTCNNRLRKGGLAVVEELEVRPSEIFPEDHSLHFSSFFYDALRSSASYRVSLR